MTSLVTAPLAGVAKEVVGALKDNPPLLVLSLLSVTFATLLFFMFEEVLHQHHEELQLLLDRPENHRRWTGEPLIEAPNTAYQFPQ